MALSVSIYATAPHQIVCAQALGAGLARHGIPVQVRRPHEYRPCDVAVMWGHRQQRIMEAQKARGARYLVMERAYFRDRFAYYSLGFDGLNGRADFVNAGSSPDRWVKHGVKVAPWKTGGGYALVCGQVIGDASLAQVNYTQWLRDAVRAARSYGLPVKFRRHPHPRAARDGLGLGVEFSRGTLEQDLAGAAVAITCNSNSGVDAALAGVPVVTYDRGAMAWPVAAHDIGQLVRPDRSQWLFDLAYAQWTLGEIQAGDAWAHLSRGLH